jgi:hypothetical protein
MIIKNYTALRLRFFPAAKGSWLLTKALSQ